MGKNFKKIIFLVFILTLALLPTLSFAQVDVGNPPGIYGSSSTTYGSSSGSNTMTLDDACGTGVGNIGDVICRIGFILNKIIPILLALGVIYFIWGVVTYMIGSEEEAKKKGKNKIIYGIIGLVVIVGMWGLVNLVVDTFGLGNPNLTITNPANVIDNNLQNTASKTTIATVCGTGVSNIGDIICRIGFILNSIIPILLVLGVVYFIWGVVTYMLGSEEEAKKKGKNKIIYGIIGLVVIVGMWGLVNLVINTFNLSQQMPIINPANVVNNNLQTTNSNSCFSNYQASGNTKLGDLINYATCVLSASVIPLLFILAVASFIWGVVQYVINSDDEAKRTKGRNFMIWGIIALTVMVSIWGLVHIFANTFNINFAVPTLKQ